MPSNVGFKGVDVRQTGNQLVFKVFLQDSTGAKLTTGTTTLALYELQSDGTFKSYDFNDNTFKTTALTTATVNMTHRQGNNATVNTGVWTYSLATLTGFTIGALYFTETNNSGASPTDQAREWQYGGLEGDGLVTAGSTGQAYVQSDNLKWVSQTIPTPNVTGVPKVDPTAINGDTTAPANLATQFNGGALTGDTYPARQQDVRNIAATGAPLNATAASRTITTGTGSGGVGNTTGLDQVYDSVSDTAGTLEFYYQFDMSGTTAATAVSSAWVGYVVGVVNTIKVFAYNWGGASWDQVGTIVGIAGTSESSEEWDLTSAHTGTGGNLGLVRIRFYATGLTAATVKTDRILLGYTVLPATASLIPAGFSTVSIANNSIYADVRRYLGSVPNALLWNGNLPANFIDQSQTVSSRTSDSTFQIGGYDACFGGLSVLIYDTTIGGDTPPVPAYIAASGNVTLINGPWPNPIANGHSLVIEPMSAALISYSDGRGDLGRVRGAVANALIAGRFDSSVGAMAAGVLTSAAIASSYAQWAAKIRFGIAGTVWHVSTAGNDTTGDGLSWTTAYLTPHKAASVAADGDVIWVGPGTFAEGTNKIDLTGGHTKSVSLVGFGVGSTIITSAVPIGSGYCIEHGSGMIKGFTLNATLAGPNYQSPIGSSYAAKLGTDFQELAITGASDGFIWTGGPLAGSEFRIRNVRCKTNFDVMNAQTTARIDLWDIDFEASGTFGGGVKLFRGISTTSPNLTIHSGRISVTQAYADADINSSQYAAAVESAASGAVVTVMPGVVLQANRPAGAGTNNIVVDANPSTDGSYSSTVIICDGVAGSGPGGAIIYDTTGALTVGTPTILSADLSRTLPGSYGTNTAGFAISLLPETESETDEVLSMTTGSGTNRKYTTTALSNAPTSGVIRNVAINVREVSAEAE